MGNDTSTLEVDVLASTESLLKDSIKVIYSKFGTGYGNAHPEIFKNILIK